MKPASLPVVVLAILLAGMAGMTGAPAAAASPDAPASLDAPAQLPAKRARLIDVNRATLDQLKSLPGIGDAWAAKIVKNRPYDNKSQLETKGVLSVAAYKRIRALIIAKR